MKTKAIKKIAERVAKDNFLPVPVTSNIIVNGNKQVEIRTEICTYDRAYTRLCEDIEKLDKSYILEAQGGCVYRVYKPE